MRNSDKNDAVTGVNGTVYPEYIQSLEDYTPSAVEGVEATISLGDTATGRIDSSTDVDLISVELTAGQMYAFTAQGLYALKIDYVLDSGGNQVASSLPSSAHQEAFFFTPETSGTYIIPVSSGYSSIDIGKNYQFRVLEVHDDEPTGTVDSALTLDVGDTYSGRIDFPEAVDVIGVYLQANVGYLIESDSANTSDGSFEELPVYGGTIQDVAGPDGASLGVSQYPGGSGNHVALYFTPTETGMHYFSFAGSHTYMGNYDFVVTTTGDDEPFGDVNTLRALAIGGSETGQADYSASLGDPDTFAVDLTAGTRYAFWVERDTYSPRVALNNIRDGAGNLLYDDTSNSEHTSYFTPTVSGTYYVTHNSFSAYTIHAEVVADDEPFGNQHSETAIAIGASRSGSFEVASDRDAYAVELVAGIRYSFYLEGSANGSSTAAAPQIVALLDDTARAMSSYNDGFYTVNYYSADYSEYNERGFFVPEESGTYYLVTGLVTYADYDDTGSGTYKVTVEEVIDDEPTGGTASTTTGMVGERYGGTIEHREDIDYIAFNVEAGGYYDISVGIPDGYNTDYYYSVRNSSGFEITSESGRFVAPSDGMIFIRIGATNYYTAVPGPFTLDINVIHDDETGGLGGTTRSLALGGSLKGILEAPGDTDHIRVTLESGIVYRFEASSNENASPNALYKPGIRIVDGEGNTVNFTETSPVAGDDGNYYTYVYAPEDGDYYVEVSSNYWEHVGGYIIAMTTVEDDEPVGRVGSNSIIELGQTYSGTTEYLSDIDYIGFETIRGMRYVVEFTSSIGDHIEMRYGSDENGNRFYLSGTRDADGNYYPYVTSSTGGTYFVEVTSDWLYTGDYTVSFRPLVNFNATYYADHLQGDASGNVLDGQNGNDTIFGFGGADRLYGGSGHDSIYGDAGADIIRGDNGNDLVAGGDGADQVFAGGDGNDTVRGDGGNDTLGGGSGDDLLIGGGTNASIFATATLGPSGDDIIFGGTGDDVIVAASWNDSGDNIVDISEILTSGSDGSNTVWAGDGSDTVYGGGQSDILGGGIGGDHIHAFGGNDILYGGKGSTSLSADTLSGDAGNDTIFGGAGNDRVTGDSGNDILYGGEDNDIVSGGDGRDLIYSGTGADTLDGGSGSDSFYFSGAHGTDSITDFSTDDDQLILANTITDFTTVADVQAASSVTTVGGHTGVLINTGGGNSIFLAGLTVADLAVIDYVL